MACASDSLMAGWAGALVASARPRSKANPATIIWTCRSAAIPLLLPAPCGSTVGSPLDEPYQGACPTESERRRASRRWATLIPIDAPSASSHLTGHDLHLW